MIGSPPEPSRQLISNQVLLSSVLGLRPPADSPPAACAAGASPGRFSPSPGRPTGNQNDQRRCRELMESKLHVPRLRICFGRGGDCLFHPKSECDSEGKFHLISLTPSSSSFSENKCRRHTKRCSFCFFYVMKDLDEKCPRQRGKEHLDACTAFKKYIQ